MCIFMVRWLKSNWMFFATACIRVLRKKEKILFFFQPIYIYICLQCFTFFVFMLCNEVYHCDTYILLLGAILFLLGDNNICILSKMWQPKPIYYLGDLH